MTAFAIAIIVANMAGAAGAAVANLVLLKVGPPEFRRIAKVNGMLATVYVASYVWLLANPGSVPIWSSTMRGVSVIAWPAVWIATPVALIRFALAFARLKASLETELATTRARLDELTARRVLSEHLAAAS